MLAGAVTVLLGFSAASAIQGTVLHYAPVICRRRLRNGKSWGRWFWGGMFEVQRAAKNVERPADFLEETARQMGWYLGGASALYAAGWVVLLVLYRTA